MIAKHLKAPIVPITLGLAIGMVDKIKYDHIGFDIVEAYQTAVKYLLSNRVREVCFCRTQRNRH